MELGRFHKIVQSQKRRGFDKYLLAPFLIFVGVKYKKLPKRVRRGLVAAGMFQIFYSWEEYMKLQSTAGAKIASVVPIIKQSITEVTSNV